MSYDIRLKDAAAGTAGGGRMMRDEYVRWLAEKATPTPPMIRDYAGQRYYYCPTCGEMVHQPGAKICDGCRQMLDWRIHNDSNSYHRRA